MRKPFRIIFMRWKRGRSGKAQSKTLPGKHAGMFPVRRTQARRLTAYLSLLVLAAVFALHYLDYFPIGNWDFRQSWFARTVKTFVSSRVLPEQREAVTFAQDALEQRIALLLDGDVEEIMDNYDLASTSGRWAYENETNRIAYLRKWASARNVRMVEAASTFEVDSVSKEDGGSYWVELTEHTVYAYEYTDDNLFESTWSFGMGAGPSGVFPIVAGCGSALNMTSSPASNDSGIRHEFGSRTVHVMEMANTDGGWKIRKDWYMDPLGNNVAEPGQATAMLPGVSMAGLWGLPAMSISNLQETSGARTLFDREKALRYAVKHAGVRALPDGGKYNPKYRIYTFAGGDCANFASQVLHAGGIPKGHGWHYTKEGSTAWVQSESLVWHLLSSGRGYRLFRGKFGEAGPGTEAESVVSQLEPGDIIAYEIKGQIYHVAVVVGKDPRGYVTIASHTADRLYFPWDLGWDESTVFWFVKISY